jgi:hypothetical protein
MQNWSTKVPSVLFYDEIGWKKLNKIVILPYFPYNPKAKLRLEVLFKKFHPRINLTTLFFTKSYLLNTIKHFQAINTVPWQKTFTRGVPLGTWTSKFWVCRTSRWLKWLREPKFQLSRSYGLGCRWGTNFCQRRRRWWSFGRFLQKNTRPTSASDCLYRKKVTIWIRAKNCLFLELDPNFNGSGIIGETHIIWWLMNN